MTLHYRASLRLLTKLEGNQLMNTKYFGYSVIHSSEEKTKLPEHHGDHRRSTGMSKFIQPRKSRSNVSPSVEDIVQDESLDVESNAVSAPLRLKDSSSKVKYGSSESGSIEKNNQKDTSLSISESADYPIQIKRKDDDLHVKFRTQRSGRYKIIIDTIVLSFRLNDPLGRLTRLDRFTQIESNQLKQIRKLFQNIPT